MKTLTYLLIFCCLTSCSTVKNNTTAASEDKDLSTLIKKLYKDPANTEVKNTLTNLYNQTAKSHLDKIEVYNALTDADKWEKLVKEYNSLLHLSDIINNSATVAKTLNVPTYSNELQTAKEKGAEIYYEIGVSALKNNDKQSAKNAYYAFRKANNFLPGYKDVTQQMNIAFEKSKVTVVIPPVRDNSFYNHYEDRLNTFRNNYQNTLQNNLVRELGGRYNKNSPAVFYTDEEAKRDNIHADWIVDLTWTDINVPQPSVNRSSRNVTKRIQEGTDTSGKPKYQTVTATVYNERRNYTAYGTLELRITDLNTQLPITSETFNDYINWQQNSETYSGDSRALDDNFSSYNRDRFMLRDELLPKDELLNRLAQRVYYKVKSKITAAVN